MLAMFALYDVKSDSYKTPFFMIANGEAVRAFTDLANDPNTVIGRHPNDFKLVRLGMFDEATGEFREEPKLSLGFATDYVKPSSVVSLKEIANG